ncbi:MAG TPA: ATP-binding cassette domain-containing protein, partial [Chitinophagaceae bacterium]|nr:ATP-binding cassette domain-containing protein [Chitinophagaceae bacterium]
FKVNKGEIVGFLGPNGAGKSTTMKILTGYLQQDGGDAIVNGINVADDSIATKKKIGYLAEANALYYDMYVKEYLGFIAEVHRIDNKQSAISNAIETVGLKVESKKRIGQLSKGYKQRVGLAAALIHDPEVLVLDEPTSGLDPNQIIEIREVIKQQGKDKTVLFSSHILQEVEAICDRVIIIHKGQLVADDKLSNLQQRNKDKHIVIVQFKETIDKNLLEKLNDVSMVEEPQISPPAGGAGNFKSDSYRIQTSNPESVRKQIVELSLQHNLNIVSLQSENQSLEEVFRSLTQKAE